MKGLAHYAITEDNRPKISNYLTSGSLVSSSTTREPENMHERMFADDATVAAFPNNRL